MKLGRLGLKLGLVAGSCKLPRQTKMMGQKSGEYTSRLTCIERVVEILQTKIQTSQKIVT